MPAIAVSVAPALTFARKTQGKRGAGNWWEVDGIEPLAPRDRVYSAATAPACPYGTSRNWLRARMRPRGFLTDLPAQMVQGLSTPSLAAGTSAVSRMTNGGCLTCRSPHLMVPSRFERAPEAALIRHPCGGRPRSRSAVANHPIAFQAMPIARSVDLPYWRMAEHSKPMPCGTIGVQSRAGEPCRFTIHGPPDRSRTCAVPAFEARSSSSELREDQVSSSASQ
jgi:hypothetical protein